MKIARAENALFLAAAFLLLAASIAFASGPNSGPAAADAIKKLLEGNQRYVQGAPQHPGATPERRSEVAAGQKPFAAVLTCSDSRVPPELIFDQGLGDLFVVRVAGNIAGQSEQGSLEYAVEHLKVPVLMVLGHTKCGAVKAACDGGHAEGALGGLLKGLAPAVRGAAGRGAKGDALPPAAEEENVRLTVIGLLKRNPVVKEYAEQGKLKVVGALYDIGTGEVRMVDFSRVLKEERKARVASVRKLLKKFKDGAMGDEERASFLSAVSELLSEME